MRRVDIMHWLTFLALLAVAACTNTPATGKHLSPGHFVVDSGVYTATGGRSPSGTWQFTVVARFTNPTTDTLYLARCMPESPQPRYQVDPADLLPERAAYSPVWACVGHDRQFGLAPGQSRTDTIVLTGPNIWDGRSGAPEGRFEGSFRLSYHLQACRGDGACRLAGSDALRQSLPFRVRLP